jgi:hypothetical protein
MQGSLHELIMKTLLSILTRNVHQRAQMMTEAYLRRAVLRQGAKSLGHRRHSFYVPQFRAGRSYLKHRR